MVVLHGHKAVTLNHVTGGKIVAGQENGRNQIQHQSKKEGNRIASNTIYQYEVSANEQALSSGMYEAKIHVVFKKQQ